MQSIYAARLLNVAIALRESADPDEYSGVLYFNSSGIPSDPIGHYTNREDLQSLLKKELEKGTRFYWPHFVETGRLAYYDSEEVLEHFGLTEEEADSLFDAHLTATAEDAAELIERYVAQKYKL